jgi:hypothetical protein
MPFFPELEKMPLSELKEGFASGPPEQYNLSERDLWLQEVAVKIAKTGHDGLSFLIRRIPTAEPARQRAILLSFSFLPLVVRHERLRELEKILVAFLDSNEPLLVAEAVDTLNSLGCTDMLQQVLSLFKSSSPYVVGSALRYLSQHFPEKGKPLLIESLESSEPIVRQNAIDELDFLRATDALPCIRLLLMDEDKHVREAAQTAITNLENIQNEK